MLLSRRLRRSSPGVYALERFDASVLVLELVALVALLVSLGSMLQAWLNVWGGLLFVGVIVLGILVPLALFWRPRLLRPAFGTALGPLLVLFGGFIFRAVVILSSEGIGRPM
jgi:hypothetical protein